MVLSNDTPWIPRPTSGEGSALDKIDVGSRVDSGRRDWWGEFTYRCSGVGREDEDTGEGWQRRAGQQTK
jgi:hypothetical protein